MPSSPAGQGIRSTPANSRLNLELDTGLSCFHFLCSLPAGYCSLILFSSLLGSISSPDFLSSRQLSIGAIESRQGTITSANMATQADVAELKTQGVIEAAQDPNSKVTAEDAQARIVHESKKAGAIALTFDPNASPEEKAAQARAVSGSNYPVLVTHVLTASSEYLRISTTSTNRKPYRSPLTLTMASLAHTIYHHQQQLVHLRPLHLRKISLGSH